MCVCALVAVVHSFLICQFCSGGAGGHAQSIQFCVPCHTYVRKHSHVHTRTHTVSPPLSTMPFGEWSQSVDTGGSQLCPSCFGRHSHRVLLQLLLTNC